MSTDHPTPRTHDALLNERAPGYNESPEDILRRCLERRGLKYTLERREILKAALSTHEHFDADSLLLRMRQLGMKASKATIYRTLVLLCEFGMLREVFKGPHGAYFEHVYGHEHHEHMICMKCGLVTEFHSPLLEELQEKACRENNFKPVRHHLQIFGLCQKCSS